MSDGAKTGTAIRYLDKLVHDTFNSALGDTGDYEGHSVIRTESGGVWYADSIDPDDEHCDDHAEIVRRVNDYPVLQDALTEALKVAGEAEKAFSALLNHLPDLSEFENRRGESARPLVTKAVESLAALERIRNNKH